MSKCFHLLLSIDFNVSLTSFFQSKVFREIYINWFVPILLHAGGRFPTPSTAQCVQMSWLGHTKSSRFSTWTHQVKYKGNMEVEIGGSEFNPYYHILWLRWSKSNQYRAYFYDCVIFSDLTWRWVQVQLVTARFYDLVGPSLTLDILNFDRGQGSSKSRAAMGSVCLPVQFKRSYKKVDIANSVATILQRPHSKWHSASDESFKDLSDTELWLGGSKSNPGHLKLRPRTGLFKIKGSDGQRVPASAIQKVL